VTRGRQGTAWKVVGRNEIEAEWTETREIVGAARIATGTTASREIEEAEGFASVADRRLQSKMAKRLTRISERLSDRDPMIPIRTTEAVAGEEKEVCVQDGLNSNNVVDYRMVR
jgi:hypothetical protein